jgi:hypothetical protein
MAKVGKVYTGSGWESLVGKSLASYQASAPVNPQIGDIWIDSDDDVPSVNSMVNYRWRKIMSGGETSISGIDSSGLPLQYTPGYEQVYLNGVLLYRNSDYIANTANTITGLTALSAGDTIEITSLISYAVGDTYTQTAADSKFQTRVATGLINVVPTSISGTYTSASVAGNGQVTFSGAIGIGLNGCFSPAYQNYKVMLNITSMPTSASIRVRFRKNGTDDSTASYNWASSYYLTSNNFQSIRSTSTTEGAIGYGLGQDRQQASIDIYSPNLSSTNKAASYTGSHGAGDINWNGAFGFNGSSEFDGINIFTSNGGVMSGTVRVYGYNNGGA